VAQPSSAMCRIRGARRGTISLADCASRRNGRRIEAAAHASRRATESAARGWEAVDVGRGGGSHEGLAEQPDRARKDRRDQAFGILLALTIGLQ
jgi:hypothetical protein